MNALVIITEMITRKKAPCLHIVPLLFVDGKYFSLHNLIKTRMADVMKRRRPHSRSLPKHIVNIIIKVDDKINRSRSISILPLVVNSGLAGVRLQEVDNK